MRFLLRLLMMLRLYQVPRPCVPISKRSSAYDEMLVDSERADFFEITPAEIEARKKKAADVKEAARILRNYPGNANLPEGFSGYDEWHLPPDQWAEKHHSGTGDWKTVVLNGPCGRHFGHRLGGK